MFKLTESSYLENMNEEELVYLKDTALKQKKAFLKATHYIFVCWALLMTVFFTIANFTYDPNAKLEEGITPLTPLVVVQIAIGLLVVLALVLGLVYYLSISVLFREIKNGKKVIEQSSITEKKFMKQTNSYHFYLTSIVKKSIEVEKKDFEFYDVNDEINVEYSPKSFQLFGYH
jgi:hypothetical protein